MPALALHGGAPAKTKPFPDWPQFDDLERQALSDVLESGIWWRTEGTQTAAFERAFADYQQARHGIAVTNGTHAIEVALAALGIRAGDEVIVPNATFVATASAALFAGALPRVVDIRQDSYCIDPELAEAAINERSKAIIAVHMGRLPGRHGRAVGDCRAAWHPPAGRRGARPWQRMARTQGRRDRDRRRFQLPGVQDHDGGRRRHHPQR